MCLIHMHVLHSIFVAQLDSVTKDICRLLFVALIYLPSCNFGSIMVHLQSSMNVTLPGAGTTGVHNPFPGPQPTIERFDDKVEILLHQ